jgi:CHAT domain-containing protein
MMGYRMKAAMVVLALLTTFAGGCGPLVGVRATISVDEQTQLEREVLGQRAQVAPEQALLMLSEAAVPASPDMAALYDEYTAMEGRLAALPNKGSLVRAWQVISVHNRGMLKAWLGDKQQAANLLKSARDDAALYWLGTLQWQCEADLAFLTGDKAGLADAAKELMDAPMLTSLDYGFESPERRIALYAALVGGALDSGDAETAFGYVLQADAVELGRAMPPGSLSVPAGKLQDAVGALQAARSDLAARREARCAQPSDALSASDTGTSPALDAARQVLAGLSAAGGLFVPAPADPEAVRELLTPGVALIDFAPAGSGRYAGFFLSADAFEAKAVSADDPVGPFSDRLKDISRLYLAVPAELSALDWQGLKLAGSTLGAGRALIYLGGISDLPWAFGQRSYGRQSLLVVGGWPEGPNPVAQRLAGLQDVSFFDVTVQPSSALSSAAAFSDLLYVASPLDVSAAAPAAGRLDWPGGLGTLRGVSAGDLCAYRTRATAAGFARASAGLFEAPSHAALRVMTRALIAARVPSVVYGTKPEATGFWTKCLDGLQKGPASQAVADALSAVPAAERAGFRLYGYAGMNDAEYAEFSKLDFNDKLRAARADLQAGRFEPAAAGFLDLSHMAGALAFPSQSEKDLVLANVQQLLVQSWQGLRRYDEAARYQKQRIGFLEARGADTPPLALGAEYQTLGALLTQAERFEDATAAYQHSIELVRGHDGEQEVAQVLGELGKSQDRAAQYDKALETFQQALDIYRQAGKQGGAAQQYQRMGAIYLRRLNNAPRAEEDFREALRLYQAADMTPDALETGMDVGLCRRSLGDFDGADALFQAALGQAQQLNLPKSVARALAELGNTAWLRGQYEQALDYVARSDELAKAQGDPFQLNVNSQLRALVYWELNQFDRAHRALDAAIEQARLAEQPLEVASGYNNHGIVYRRETKYDDALASFAAALDIDTRLSSRWGQGYDERNIGMTLHLMGKLDEAGPHLESAVKLSAAIDDRVNHARAVLALGELRLDQDRPDDARPLLQAALDESRRLHMPEVEWRALEGLGRLDQAAGRREAALDEFKKGIDVVEGMRAEIKVEEFQSGFLANKMDLYEDAVGLMLQLGLNDEAFAYAERSRARRFMDVLAGRQVELKSDREKQLYARQQDLARRIRGLSEAVGQEADAARRAALKRQLLDLQKQFSDLLVDIRVADPALSSFVSVDVATPAEMAKELPPDLTLVSYYMLKSELAIWVLREGKLTVTRVPVDRDALTDQVRRFRLLIQNRELLDVVRRRSEALNHLLIEPIADRLTGSGTIAIVPHRGLHYLSFASLYDGQAFLIERHPVVYAPSASVLARTLQGAPQKDKANLRVLAVGDPAVGNPAYELPFSEREVVSIQRDFTEVTPLLGEQASKDAVEADAGRFDVIHIGAHAMFDPDNPLFSTLVLAPGKDNGMLHLYEVTGLKLDARLVTLSACQTGLGELTSGDDLISLGRAFTYAGSRAIISTLWRVDDVATALVTKHFYRQYVDHGAAESLRDAQLSVMNDGLHYHPMYWAGVVLTGDYR